MTEPTFSTTLIPFPFEKDDYPEKITFDFNLVLDMLDEDRWGALPEGEGNFRIAAITLAKALNCELNFGETVGWGGEEIVTVSGEPEAAWTLFTRLLTDAETEDDIELAKEIWLENEDIPGQCRVA